MAKEPAEKRDVLSWFKVITWFLGLVFVGGMLYANVTGNSEDVKTVSDDLKTEAILRTKADDESERDLDIHKEKNLATEKEQNKKHEAIVEQLHQNEIMVQRQLAVAESLLQNAEEAKSERKEIMKSQNELVKSQIKLEAELSKWGPTD